MITDSIQWFLKPNEILDKKWDSPHHRFPGFSDDVSNVLALKPHTESKSESVEGEQNPLSEMTCVYFDDGPINRKMVGKFMEKKWFKNSSVFDTGVQFTSKCELIKANRGLNKKVLCVEEIKQRFEWRKMETADIIITDINDTDSVDDPSGWLRRGKMALEAWKIVLFVSAQEDNKEVIDREFSAQYRGQYIFLAKPYGFEDIEKAMQILIGRRSKM